MAEFSQEEKDNIQKQFDELLRLSPKCHKNEETLALVKKAFSVANEAHYGTRRRSGEPYILHPIAVARIVSDEIGLGSKSVISALLHDVVEDTDITLEDINNMFGPKIAQIVDGLTKIRGVLKNKEGQAENFKKIVFTLSEDVRVIIIKLADRLHNMRTLDSMPPEKQKRIAEETNTLFVPLAHRMGFYNIKMELEDLCLKYLNPTVYFDILHQLKGSEKKRIHYLNRFCIPIMMTLEQHNINYTITSRSKSISSIWAKMQKKNITFDNVYDVFAVRIILQDIPLEEEKAMCWRVYSYITDKYTPNPERLRDWISTPKDNGYEALHTTVMGPDGTWVEVQIRTQRMDEIAEQGYAAHWKYKNVDGFEQSQLEVWMKRVRSSLMNPDEDALKFLDDFKLNLYSTDLFAFTPKGEMHRFPVGATALDFAYEIHSEIGHHAIGARINKQKVVALDYKLQSGDQVEILTSESQKPQKDWVKIISTVKANNALQQAFKYEKKRNIMRGQQILSETLEEKELPQTPTVLDKLVQGYGLVDKNELYEKLGADELDKEKIVEYATNKRKSKKIQWWSFLPTISDKKEETEDDKDVKVIYHSTKYTIADCCHPIPGDQVIGFKTDTGYEIHKNNCPIAIERQQKEVAQKIKWISRQEQVFLTSIQLKGKDRIGILHEITGVITNQLNVNIRTVHTETMEKEFTAYFDMYIHDSQQLNTIMMKLQKIKGILKVERVEQRNWR
ncbi:MAG: bifunctional (p)ppGpp synthetase/guanosine-3',5'-bis(diphosphate) 3'-pyrophosphohydrolase [Bacteroidales bacterium]|nr:bifunctional (p)ppGpp synthetase/guanosine-3',5'-bis(diphosphate) 3'-pyrophosphohydrolase [Bacteroidales bacterium]